jgi:hypothetical protein
MFKLLLIKVVQILVKMDDILVPSMTAVDVVRAMDEAAINELLPDMPPGPLSEARAKASFCWRKMRIFMEEEGLLRFKVKFYCLFLIS